MKKTLLLTALMLTFNIAQAEDKTDCAINYARTACKGQETTSYKKCNGQASCTHFAPAASPEACQAEALKACANDRLDVTKSKIITASFKGNALTSKSGQSDFCIDYANKGAEFNQCPEDKKK